MDIDNMADKNFSIKFWMVTKYCFITISLLLTVFQATATHAGVKEQVVDIPSRPGITQRILFLKPEHPKAAVILFPGGHGGLMVSDRGSIKWGEDNFLVRTRKLFAKHDFIVAVVDVPSDRKNPPYLDGFRQRPEHAEDIKAVVAWLKQQAGVSVWLVGTSRGTQSAAFVATQLSSADGGPDGLVLTSSILHDDKSRPVQDMPLGKITVPVLVVHHEKDSCQQCPYAEIPQLMDSLSRAARKELLSFKGGENRANPCGPLAYHGFNGIDRDVVNKITDWILAK